MITEPHDRHDSLLKFLHLAPIGLVQCNLAGEIDTINPMAASLLMPMAPDASMGNVFDTLHQAAPQLRAKVAAYAQEQGEIDEAIRITVPLAPGQAPGSARQVLSIGLFKAPGARLMVSITDVTAQVAQEQRGLHQRLQDASRIDSLTQLPNRAAVSDEVRRCLARANEDPNYQFAVIFLNCDRFKQINDSLGQAVGDEMLGMIADRFRATLRQSDPVGRNVEGRDVAGRVGGDEFLILLDCLRGPDAVHSVARRLLEVLTQPYRIGTHVISCGFSMGVVLQAQLGGEADTVIQDASIAMVEAKRAGGARYQVFEPDMRERAAKRGSIEVDLRIALSDNQLFVVYQPVVGLHRADGQPGLERSVGVEALVRWRHPVRGIVPPLEFIGVAEECGLIDAVGHFVLAESCRQFMLWREHLGEKAPRLMAVNLSRAQLHQASLVNAVSDILQCSGMPPQALQLEITESLAAQDENVQQCLRELKGLNLTLALDDFGTGYSSLASLHLLPVDVVKVDRSFVSQVSTSHHHRVLIEATVNVAKSLGMGTVAEGIETQEQAQMVTQLGCEKGQGFLFSKPLLPDEIEAWLRQAP
jgi:diguanylate cyclase (GGDEF)-like protein